MPDRYLSYHYDNKFYNTKWQAWESAISDGHLLHVAQTLTRAVLNQDVTTFDNFDWSVEPSESWEELLKQRAQMIRDTYPHVALSYSGGSDSHTILETFLRNNIRLDEIVINKDRLAQSDTLNTEIDNWAIATAKLLSPNIKVTVRQYDHASGFFDEVSERQIFESGGILVPDGFGTLQRAYKPKDNSILINGTAEPVIYLDKETNKYFINMFDTDGFLNAFLQPNVIPFFTDPAFPQLHSKQCHIMKNLFRTSKIHVDMKENFSYYKSLSIKMTRSSTRLNMYKKSPFFDKDKKIGKVSSFTAFGHIKTNFFFRQLAKHEPELVNKFFHTISQPFNGIPLKNHLMGVEIGKYYLE